MTKDECINEVVGVLMSDGAHSDRELRLLLESLWNQGVTYGLVKAQEAMTMAIAIPNGMVAPLPLTAAGAGINAAGCAPFPMSQVVEFSDPPNGDPPVKP